MTSEDRLADIRAEDAWPAASPARVPRPITSDMLASPPPRRDGRMDFERGMRYAPPLTLALLAANIALFVWQLAVGALESREAIVQAGALVRDRVLAGEVWRLLSAA
ncbi:MAG TPA: hypothetical protein VFS05_16865, partial [Gemmatimonadaceae bacterium]|nr:hypothetical protein [Gemmatimonadaceae bacterium]